MIISHKYRFIFIKTFKTAGTSVEVFLSPRCGPEDVVTPIYPQVAPHHARNFDGFYNHIPAHEVMAKVPRDIWDGYFKFCVERNPWDKTLSHYHMVNFRKGGTLPFEEYMAKREFCQCYQLYTDATKTRVLVDRVLRYENLMAELGEVLGKLGVPFEGTLNCNAKAEYRTDRRPYREVYTEEQRRVIEEEYAWEIQTHGYRF